MKDMRTIHDLLIILRDNAKVTKSWFGLKQRINSGLCNEISLLDDSAIINIDEYWILKDYIRDNKPIEGQIYYWTKCEWKPRLNWLNEHIELTRDK